MPPSLSLFAETHRRLPPVLLFVCSSSSTAAPANPPFAMPTSFPTCRAVKVASPVAIMTRLLEAMSALITSSESVRTRQANAKNPANSKSHSTSSRDNGDFASLTLFESPGDNTLCASAITRIPFSANVRYCESNPSGLLFNSVAIFSGDPFTSAHVCSFSPSFC